MAIVTGADLIGQPPLAVAQFCARLGWRVMPLRPETKTPMMRKWPELATTDPELIEYWWLWKYGINCPVGVLTGPESGIWVLDIDVKWCNGFEALRDMFHRHGVTEVPRTFRVNTPSGGQQWYFTYPKLATGWKVKNTTSSRDSPGRLGPGLEVRGWHGQVVAPDQPGRSIICEDLSRVPAPVEAPDWLLDLVTEKPRTRAQVARDAARWKVGGAEALHLLNNTASRLALMPNGGRNSALNKAAFLLAQVDGLGTCAEAAARMSLHDACRRNGLIADDGEESFDATFNSGWTAGLTAGGTQ